MNDPGTVRPIRRPLDPYVIGMVLLASVIAGAWHIAQHIGALGAAPISVLTASDVQRITWVTYALFAAGGLSVFIKPTRRFALLLIALGWLIRPAASGALYPLSLVRADIPGSKQLVLEGMLLGTLLFAGMLLALWPARREVSLAHGSAGFGGGEALMKKRGLPLGKKKGKWLRYSGDGHLITIAPTRSGKGVSAVIPALLTYSGPVVCVDIKGENTAITARCRRESFNQAVFVLDPFEVTGGFSARFNPLDSISAENAFDESYLLADMLITPKGPGDFWQEEARALIAGLIYYLVASEKPEVIGSPLGKNLISLRHLLTLPPDSQEAFFESLLDLGDPIISRTGARMLQKADKERSGVLSTAQSATHFLDAPAMEAALGRSSAALEEMLKGSVFLVLPPDRIATYRPWMRVILASLLTHLLRQRQKQRVLFLLDEFAALGRMDIFTQAVGLMAGYGVSFWIFLQDLAQLRAIYPKSWETYLANAELLQAFSPRDPFTCSYLSKRTGQRGVFVRSDSVNKRAFSYSVSETARPLLLPDELARLPPGKELLFLSGELPVLADRIKYYRDFPASWADPFTQAGRALPTK